MKLILIRLIGLLILPAIGHAQNTTTAHGFPLVHHVKKGGTMAQPGDKILAHVITYIGDSLMQDTRRPESSQGCTGHIRCRFIYEQRGLGYCIYAH
jgi:hypothetical protein